MTVGKAGDIDIQVYPGARFSQRFEFFVGKTDEVYDLSGQGPWVAEITDGAGVLVAILDVDDSEASDGALNLSIERDDTELLAWPLTHRWGLQNGSGEYVLDGSACITRKATR